MSHDCYVTHMCTKLETETLCSPPAGPLCVRRVQLAPPIRSEKNGSSLTNIVYTPDRFISCHSQRITPSRVPPINDLPVIMNLPNDLLLLVLGHPSNHDLKHPRLTCKPLASLRQLPFQPRYIVPLAPSERHGSIRLYRVAPILQPKSETRCLRLLPIPSPDC